ncbi:MAG: hypothetical protein Kow00109_03290 [Acidobacteriota bacterium]
MQAIKDLVDRILAEAAQDPGSRVALLQARWPAVVGELVAAASRPVACQRGCLVVEVEDATWAGACEEHAGIILARVRSLLRTDQIRRVAFRLRGGRGGGPETSARFVAS